MEKVTQQVLSWISEYFKGNDQGKAVIGISGGKDSTVCAGLLSKALGVDRVIFVLMPNGEQYDISDSFQVLEHLQVPEGNRKVINIGKMYSAAIQALGYKAGDPISPVVTTNLPSRLRMSVLYAVAAEYPGSRVVNTCNRSEDYVGYSTKFGDAAGDFSPLAELTVREVLEIGDDIGMPRNLVHKAPSDGMCGSTDEMKLGFTYQELDDFLLGTGTPCEKTMEKIQRLENCGRRRAFFKPYFLRSTARASRVRKPAFLRSER